MQISCQVCLIFYAASLVCIPTLWYACNNILGFFWHVCLFSFSGREISDFQMQRHGYLFVVTS